MFGPARGSATISDRTSGRAVGWHRRLVWPLIGLLVVAAAAWAIHEGVAHYRRRQTGSSLSVVGYCLQTYSLAYGHLPYPVIRQGAPAPPDAGNGDGRPLYSWRVAISPYLGSFGGRWEKEQRWDSLVNRSLAQFSSYFAYQEDRPNRGWRSFPAANAMAITGPGTAFGDGTKPPLAIKDLPGDTILVVECRNSGVPWAAPKDFDIRTMPKTINPADGRGISSRHSGGFHLIFADAECWFLSNDVPFESLARFFTVEGAAQYDRDQILAPFRLAR